MHKNSKNFVKNCTNNLPPEANLWAKFLILMPVMMPRKPLMVIWVLEQL